MSLFLKRTFNVLLICTLAGCGENRPEDSKITLDEETEVSIPWDVESIAEEVKHKLLELDLKADIDGDAPELQLAFRENALVVKRAPSLSFDAYRSLFKGYEIEESEVKVVKVELKDSSAQMRALTHFLATDASGKRRQFNAVWDSTWSRDFELEKIEVLNFEQIDLAAPERKFVDATAALLKDGAGQLGYGIHHWVARIEMEMGAEVSGWHGFAIADINGDGLEDVYICEPGGLPNRLFIQNSKGSLADVSAESGMDWLDNTTAALFCDVDNDGDSDAVVSISDGVMILENDGKGVFSLRVRQLMPRSFPYSLSACDYDANGLPDIFVCSYHNRAGAHNEGGIIARPVPYHDATNGGRNMLLKNAGGFQFSQVTKESGMDENNVKFSYAATWDDYDDDGDFDLYVANDFGRNHFFKNMLAEEGTARFVDVAEAAGLMDIAAGMSACWGDYNNDARPDLYVSNMFSSAGNRIAFQPEFHAKNDEAVRAQFQRHARGNSLFENSGDSSFKDVSEVARVTMGRWAWGSRFADINNDGWQDILVANGFITNEKPDDL